MATYDNRGPVFVSSSSSSGYWNRIQTYNGTFYFVINHDTESAELSLMIKRPFSKCLLLVESFGSCPNRLFESGPNLFRHNWLIGREEHKQNMKRNRVERFSSRSLKPKTLQVAGTGRDGLNRDRVRKRTEIRIVKPIRRLLFHFNMWILITRVAIVFARGKASGRHSYESRLESTQLESLQSHKPLTVWRKHWNQ